MVQAIITLDEHDDRILNIVKGKYGLKNKSEAIKLVIRDFEKSLGPGLRPDYKEELLKVDKGRFRKASIAKLRKEIENA